MLDKPPPAKQTVKNTAAEGGSFPTPYCQYISDRNIKHEQNRSVCFNNTVYECRDPRSANPKDAWPIVATGGCGGVRDVSAFENETRRLRDLSGKMSRE